MKDLIFFHSKNSRAVGVLALLEELGADYELRRINIREGENRKPDYLKINPMGKVPAILHKGALVTEQVAIYIYLADVFTKANLAPPIGDPLRGPYLRWMAFYGSCFEPALVDKALKREPGGLAMSPYGDFETMYSTLTEQMSKGPYVLGERYTALDILYGSALGWMTAFNLLPASDRVKDYIKRIHEKHGFQRAREIDA